MIVQRLFALCLCLAVLPTGASAGGSVRQVRSNDGTPIAVECEGAGPELLIVHGGVGDRTRWTPIFAHLRQQFTVCAMDRRGRGQSGDGPAYALAREAEDVAAVAWSRGRPVAVLGHSFGGVVALDAAFLTPAITRLMLYEPPVRVPDDAPALARMEELIKAGDPDAAARTFQLDIVRASPDEVAALRTRPVWKTMVATIEGSIRQHRALTTRAWNPEQLARLRIPTLLLIGEHTRSPHLRRSVDSLAEALPNERLVVLKGQEHNAMDSDRERLAAVIGEFLKAHP